MPNLHIIIGDSNTRKSSLLRCLTGFGGANGDKNMDILLSNGSIITVHCILSALQEHTRKTPTKFVAYVNALVPIPTDIAITLRVSAVGIYPQATDYLTAFAAVGWPVSSIALLGPSACALQGLPASARIANILNSPNRPTNESAQAVRSIWGWI